MSTAIIDTAKRQRPPAETKPQVAERWYSEKRLGGLSRFAFAITVLNILGHLFLGFEQSWITPFAALAAAYSTDLIGETVEAHCNGRRARYAGSFLDLVKFLLPAHISALAVGMLLYAAENVAAVAFAASLAMASKYVLRVVVGLDRQGRPLTRHFFNPSNIGITVTLILFPTVGIAPPYQFTENISGAFDWLLPLIVIGTGSMLNLKATGRMPLILSWAVAFAAQAILRALIDGTPIAAGLMPMTGFAFVLFSFYMITDPATTPARLKGQIGFAIAVAAGYALFMELHIVFGLFYALTLASTGRALWLFATRPRAAVAPRPAPAPQLSPAE